MSLEGICIGKTGEMILPRAMGAQIGVINYVKGSYASHKAVGKNVHAQNNVNTTDFNKTK